MFKYNYIYFI